MLGVPFRSDAGNKLSDYVNYNRAYGAYIMAGLGEHYIVGTNYADTIVAAEVGNNWYDGGSDIGYVKYVESANDVTGSISTVTSADKKTIEVVQTQSNTTTELMKFTLNDTSATDKYWSVEQLNTTFAQLYLNSSIGSQGVTLKGVEQAVFVLPSSLLNSNDQPVITLTGLASNNIFVVDLTVV